MTESVNRNIWIVAACAIWIGLPMHRLAAQAALSIPVTDRNSCVDTVSMEHAVPSIVYVEGAISDSVDRRAGSMADIFAQSVAQQLRLMLHTRGDTLAPGEPVITWRGIKSHIPLGVTAYRKGGAKYELLTPHFDSLAAAMLLSASHAAEDASDGVLWPSDMPGDSVKFGISFVLSQPGTMQIVDPDRTAFPVFSVMFPPETPAKLASPSTPRYPTAVREAGVTGVVIVEFQIDSTGHTVPRTAKEIWNSGTKRPTGELLGYYNQLLHSVLDWVSTAKFEPARIGGCPVPQIVKQPFTFSIRN